MRPHVGMEVTPSIRLLRPVGVGGMGSVWVARHAGLETNVAVKFLLADLTASEGALLRFTDEASVAAQVKSPHVVQVYDHGLLDGELPFIVMEFLEGQDLGARVTRRGTLDLATTAILVQQLGQVLAKAHAAGIVHRDIKPENVFLLDGYGELFLKLIDFGIAKWTTRSRSLTATGTMVGTPDFMCPEQILNAKDVGPAADLWGLAGVAYFCLVGRPPFSRDTLPATILAIEKGEFPLPFERHGIGTSALDAFFLRGLCRHQAGRFASLSDLVGTFCEAAQVPITRTLRLVAGFEEAVPSSGVVASFEEERKGVPLDALVRGPRAHATQLGPAASALAAGGSQVPTRIVPPPVPTLESGTLVQESPRTDALVPHPTEHGRAQRVRSRTKLLLVAGLSLAAGAGLAFARWDGENWLEDARNLVPIQRRPAGLVGPQRAVAAPSRERIDESPSAVDDIQLETSSRQGAQVSPEPLSTAAPGAVPSSHRQSLTVPSLASQASATKPQRSPSRSATPPRPPARSSAPKPAVSGLPSADGSPSARNLKDRGF